LLGEGKIEPAVGLFSAECRYAAPKDDRDRADLDRVEEAGVEKLPGGLAAAENPDPAGRAAAPRICQQSIGVADIASAPSGRPSKGRRVATTQGYFAHAHASFRRTTS
jgi:hypothetical protein